MPDNNYKRARIIVDLDNVNGDNITILVLDERGHFVDARDDIERREQLVLAFDVLDDAIGQLDFGADDEPTRDDDPFGLIAAGEALTNVIRAARHALRS